MALVDDRSLWLADPGPVPLLPTTVADLLAEAVGRAADREALVMSAYDAPELTVRWTYRELAERVDCLARALVALGVQPRDRVALWAPNVPEWVVTEFAAARVGAVLVPANPTYRADEIRHVLELSGAVACLFLPDFERLDLWSELREIRDALPRLRHLVSLGGPVEDVSGLADVLRQGDSVDLGELDRRTRATSADDLAQIQFTSGTTGRPKGAALTHHNVVNNARQSAWLWNVEPGDRWCNPLPLFHTAGCAMLTLGAVAAAATHLPLVRFDADKVLDTIERERCTIVSTVPTILTALVDRQRLHGADLGSLRLVGTSGAPTPHQLGQACLREWGAPLRVLYGSTELSPTVAGTSPYDHGDLGWTTVGRPLPWTAVRVVDPETDEVVAVNSSGELQVSGYQVMRGYHEDSAATAAATTSDGWFRTGDLATLDAEGRLRIIGRLKDVLIRGGENLYPAEIEEAIRGYDGILEVAVVGVPDPFFGEEACAVVTVKNGCPFNPEALRLWLRERVTHQKVPRYVYVVDSLPQTGSGKVKKFLLREEMTRRYAAE
ncbi:AMP-binding protein [Nonomuraea sp. NPDC026600]|uniref:AMP-binding protein n=1 Tax=Nonomuraea sp. NPDC026600 TaxID=3155363 RepID=UPI0033C14F02